MLFIVFILKIDGCDMKKGHTFLFGLAHEILALMTYVLSHSFIIYMLNSLPTGSLSLLIFFKINFSENFFQEYHQSVKQFGSRSGTTFCQA